MCDPLSISIASAGVGAVGALQSGMAASNAARTNAAMLEVQAQRRDQKAAFEVRQAEHTFDVQQGALRNRVSTSGLTAGSFSDLFAADATEKALQVEGIKWSAKNDTDNLKDQASAERSKASSATTSMFFNAAGAVVGAAGGYYKSSNLGKGGATSISSPFSSGDGWAS
jgi:hypothetical protein